LNSTAFSQFFWGIIGKITGRRLITKGRFGHAARAKQDHRWPRVSERVPGVRARNMMRHGEVAASTIVVSAPETVTESRQGRRPQNICDAVDDRLP